jgi:hypothetical protein
MADTFAAVRQRVADPGDRALLDQLNTTMTQLARLTLKPLEGAGLDERRKSIAELEARKERLEADLSEHSAELRARIQPVTLEAVQAALPGDGVLLEFAVFRPFDPKAERNAEAYGPPHYAASCAKAGRRSASAPPRRLTRRSTRCGRRCATRRAPTSRSGRVPWTNR